LSALDKKLREQMQIELRRLQKAVGITFILVTHDQYEALAMSDRIAVMNAGRIEQVGTPSEIYERPRTRFVADFIGEINLFDGAWQSGRLVIDDQAFPGAFPAPAGGSAAAAAIRPEKLVIGAAGNGGLQGQIETANFLGGHTLYRVLVTRGRPVLVKETNSGDRPVRAIGEAVSLTWDPADVVLLEA
jgi:putative spermidine/putrescine transport system ATP-binding protein